jgi:hypothetical protein
MLPLLSLQFSNLCADNNVGQQLHIIGLKIIETGDLNSREEVFSRIEHIGRYIAKGLYS